MAFEVVMPRLGWNMEEGTISAWRKLEGESVEEGEVLFEVESDKAVQEVEALESGILRFPEGSPAVGDTVPVGTVLAYLVEQGESVPTPADDAGPKGPIDSTASRQDSDDTSTSRNPAGDQVTSDIHGVSRISDVRSRLDGPAISPRARRVARELGIEFKGLKGSGRTGRIVERDVRQAARPESKQSVASLGDSPPLRAPDGRAQIAAAMSASKHNTAAVTLTTEVDATDLVELRNRFRKHEKVVPSITSILVKLVGHALLDFPSINATQGDGELRESNTVDIGVAVDTERALLVPVVREVETKPLLRIATEVDDLVQRTRNGSARPEELRGGSFTITNLGMFGIDAFTPIINLPQCAILGVGRIVPKPVVQDVDSGTIGIRQLVYLSLTFDHRIVDGAPAARFLERISQYVREPYLWLSE